MMKLNIKTIGFVLYAISGIGMIVLFVTSTITYSKSQECSGLADKHSYLTGVPSHEIEHLVIDGQCIIYENPRFDTECERKLRLTKRVKIDPESIEKAWKKK